MIAISLLLSPVLLGTSHGDAQSTRLSKADPCGDLAPQLRSFSRFIEEGCYQEWPRDKGRRLSGAFGTDGKPYTVHDRFRVYYSPAMARWMKTYRSGQAKSPGPADGAAMIAEVYAVDSGDGDRPQDYVFMYRDSAASHDGWFWGRFDREDPSESRAEFGYNVCMACHALAFDHLTFASYRNLEQARPDVGGFAPPPEPGQPLSPVPAPAHDRLSKPLSDARAKRFIDFYNSHVPGLGLPLPKDLPASDIAVIPPRDLDHVYALGAGTGERFTTSDQCQGCHDGTELLSNTRPNMIFKTTEGDVEKVPHADWSFFGEWSVSLMGLAGRDPVFLAQAETERHVKPGVPGNLIDNLCYSCHGPMGQRQYVTDLAGAEPRSFSHYMIYSTPRDSAFYRAHHGRAPYDNRLAAPRYADFGALARDGVSCGACHHIGPADGRILPAATDLGSEEQKQAFWEIFYGPRDDTLPARQDPPGPPYPFTAHFEADARTIFAKCPPFEPCPESPGDVEPVARYGHDEALGVGLVNEPYFSQSDTCGSCHVVIVPKVPHDYVGDPLNDPEIDMAYEQTTYFEWLVSEYGAQDLPCQGCHMPEVVTGVAGEKTTLDIANIESSYFPEVDYRAHRADVTLANGNGLQARKYSRHRLLGINLFVHEMFQQFHDILGLIDPVDRLVPTRTVLNLLTAKQSIIDHAIGDPPTVSAEICGFEEGDEHLSAEVLVVNNAGHKFPTGVGFRRGWIELEVLGKAGEVLWSSGSVNDYGAILDPTRGGQVLANELTRDPTLIERHYEKITRQDQVQIYELREVDCRLADEEDLTRCECPDPSNNCHAEADGFRPPRLTSSFLTLFDVVKDNRILPRGWGLSLAPEMAGLEVGTLLKVTAPEGRATKDAYYEKPWLTGTDRVTYQVPRSDLRGYAEPSSVRVTLHYQTLPPYYLVERFEDGKRVASAGHTAPGSAGFGTAVERLLYMTSHLDTEVRTPDRGDDPLVPEWTSRFWTMNLSVDVHRLGDAAPRHCETLEDLLKRRHERLRRTLRQRSP